MKKSFSEWYIEDFGKNKDTRLYHEWLVDQMFPREELTEQQRRRVMLLVHESLLEGMHTGPVIKVHYCQELTKRVKIPAGEHKGQTIYNLPNTDETWTLCSQIKRTTKNSILRQACTAKLNEIQVNRENRRAEAKTRNRGKI